MKKKEPTMFWQSLDLVFILHWLLISAWFWHHPEPLSKHTIPLLIHIDNLIWMLFFPFVLNKWFSGYKLPTSSNNFVNAKVPSVPEQLMVAFFNISIVSLCYYMFEFPLHTRASQQGWFVGNAFHILVEVMLCYCLFEIIQTALHKLMHTPWFFLRIHRWHHLVPGEDSYTGFYMHPVDIFAQVIFPTFIPTLYVCTCVESVLFFFLIGMWYSHSGHSGFVIPYVCSAEYHKLHHQDFTKGFAPLLELLFSSPLTMKRRLGTLE